MKQLSKRVDALEKKQGAPAHIVVLDECEGEPTIEQRAMMARADCLVIRIVYDDKSPAGSLPAQLPVKMSENE